jgi:ribosome-associated heat shock protein Hsp15
MDDECLARQPPDWEQGCRRRMEVLFAYGSIEMAEERHRLDKWLWCVRLFKTRSLAAQAVTGGRVHLNGERVKAAHVVRVGDHISLNIEGTTAEFDVLGLPARRGPAPEARAHYAETPESTARREKMREQHRIAELSRPRSDTRPDKRQRRQLAKFQRGDG